MSGKTKPAEKNSEIKPGTLSSAKIELDALESYMGDQPKKKSSPSAMIPTVFGTPEQVAAQKKYVEENTTVIVDGKEMTLNEYRERKKNEGNK